MAANDSTMRSMYDHDEHDATQVLPQGEKYAALVHQRKQCHRCLGLTNPADPEYAVYDTDHIGPWSRWQGNLNAPLMIVGQDWGDTAYYKAHEGREKDGNPTNTTLKTLLQEVGITIQDPSAMEGAQGPIFLTNAILCLKQGGLQGPVNGQWFQTCGQHFLKPTIDLIRPRVLVSLGQWAYRTVSEQYGLSRPRRFRDAVNHPEGFALSAHTRLFPVYHCGQRILNTHRPLAQQRIDWQRIYPALGRVREENALPIS